jgi:predicted DNA-binding transcriptional regulator AlpA
MSFFDLGSLGHPKGVIRVKRGTRHPKKNVVRKADRVAAAAHARAAQAEGARLNWQDDHAGGITAGEVRLLDKHEVMRVTGTAWSTLYAWMRAGKFPRSRVVGGRSMWRSDEIRQWIDALPPRRLKGDEVA